MMNPLRSRPSVEIPDRLKPSKGEKGSSRGLDEHLCADAQTRSPQAEPIDLPFRKVPEWIGKTPDSKVPQKVKLRVFLRYQGRCHITGRTIRGGEAWDVEHVKPLRNTAPGEPHLNRESNLAPALKAPHQEKTAIENSDGAKADRCHAKHYGYAARKSAGFKGWRKMNGEIVWREK